MLETILGLALMVFAFLFLAYILQDKHQVMKVGAIFFAVFFMLLVGKSVLDNQQHCEILVNYTNNVYVYGSNFSGYHWDYDYDLLPAQAPDYELFHIKSYPTYDRYCFDTGFTTENTAYSMMTWWFRSVYLYLIGFVIYIALMYLVNLRKDV